MKKSALFVLAIVTTPLAWYLAILRPASSYLLLDIAAHGRWILFAHLAALALSATLFARTTKLPPWRLAELFAATSLTTSFANLALFFAFEDHRWFVFAAFFAAILTGASFGALGAIAARVLRGVRPDVDALSSALRVEVLAIALAGVLSAIVLVERLGQLRTSLACSTVLGLLGVLAAVSLAADASPSRRASVISLTTSGIAAVSILLVEPFTPFWETPRLPDPLVAARETESARVVLTAGRGAFQLYVDGLLRSSTIDSARRREAAILPVMSAARRHERVLVIGGGDGATTRELLRFEDAHEITVVDADASLLEMARSQPVLRDENANAFDSSKVRAIAADPLAWLRASTDHYDVIVLDLLDPDGPARSKLYTAYFQKIVRDHLENEGIGVTVAPSPFAARRAFWCVVTTLESLGLFAIPYQADVPTIGVAGFVLFAHAPFAAPTHVPISATYVDDFALHDMLTLSPDEAREPAEANLLYRQVLAKYRDDDAP